VGDAGAAKMPMNASYLVDTNILVYAYDRTEHEKQRKVKLPGEE
jgi:predicted nucleic acid-binding protein